ncbi:hypothetical protein ASE93_01560 [Serratia sp. Leaf50]|nr:hypothetical protein ASE93_01560 [Serratia sp. Leaf50]
MSKQQNREEIVKWLRNMDSLKRWFCIIGVVLALCALVNYFHAESGSPGLILQLLLAAGCMGYCLFLSHKITQIESDLYQHQ